MEQKTLELLKIATNIFLIGTLLVCAYYYIAHTTEVNEAMGWEKPTRLIEIYENKTGEYCLCYKDFKDMLFIPQ